MTVPDPAHAESGAIAFFETALAAFEQAHAHTADCSAQSFTLGPCTIHISVAGYPLGEKMTRAFGHLPASTAPPDLTVYMWDDLSTHARMPPPPWDWDTVLQRRGEIRGFNTERIYTSYDGGADTLHVFDRATHTALLWTRNANTLPGYEQSAPLRTILHWFFVNQGLQVVHGGAVGTTSGGVLLAGKGGSGKSTSTLACLDSELLYAADDYCLVALTPEPFVYSLYSSAKLTPESLERLPQLSRAVAFSDPGIRDKSVLFLAEHWREKISLGFPLRAILLPRVRGTGEQTVITPANATEGLRALGMSTMIQLPRANASTAKFIQQLVDTLPCYWLELGTDLSKIPSVISEFIARKSLPAN